MIRLTEGVKHLLLVNVIFFIAIKFSNIDIIELFGYHSPTSNDFKYWQIITSMFIHFDFQHLLFNMISLWMFGTTVEHYLGTKRFVFLYFSAGLGAILISSLIFFYQYNEIYNILINAKIKGAEINQIINLNIHSTERFIDKCNEILNNNSAIKPYNNLGNDLVKLYSISNKISAGASGAIFGILASFGIYFPNNKIILFPIPIPIKSYIIIICLFVSELILGTYSIPGDTTGRFAHIGGALIGGLIAWYWKKNNKNH